MKSRLTLVLVVTLLVSLFAQPVSAASDVVRSCSLFNISSTSVSPKDPATFSGDRSGKKTFADTYIRLSTDPNYVEEPIITDQKTEQVTAFVTRFYRVCLGRNPDSVGLEHWTSGLLNQTLTGSEVAYGFVFSTEFLNANLNPDEFIEIMYQAFFDRESDPAGLEMWATALTDGMSRLYVLHGFTNSKEFQELCNSFGILPGSLTLTDPADLYPSLAGFVSRFYVVCLEKEPDRDGLNYWVAKLISKEQTGRDIAYIFFLSPEFSSKSISDEEYITIVYRALFNREPDSVGFSNWISQLKSGISRNVVLEGFVNSVEYDELCSSYGILRG